MGVKKLIDHREITLAIGILVAVVIALTLWIAGPRTELTGSNALPALQVPAPKKAVQSSVTDLFSFVKREVFHSAN